MCYNVDFFMMLEWFILYLCYKEESILNFLKYFCYVILLIIVLKVDYVDKKKLLRNVFIYGVVYDISLYVCCFICVLFLF